jgi:hypothetical protein
MKLLERLPRAWQHLGITTKFALAFALLLGMIIVEAVVAMLALGDVRKAEAVILSSAEIASASLKWTVTWRRPAACIAIFSCNTRTSVFSPRRSYTSSHPPPSSITS